MQVVRSVLDGPPNKQPPLRDVFLLQGQPIGTIFSINQFFDSGFFDPVVDLVRSRQSARRIDGIFFCGRNLQKLNGCPSLQMPM
jgi:hypothetical protein